MIKCFKLEWPDEWGEDFIDELLDGFAAFQHEVETDPEQIRDLDKLKIEEIDKPPDPYDLIMGDDA